MLSATGFSIFSLSCSPTFSQARRKRSTMVFSPFSSFSSTNFTACEKTINHHNKIKILCCKKLKTSSSSSSLSFHHVLHKSVLPLAASLTLLLSPIPAKAGLLSGFPGIESVPGPQLPQIDFLNRLNGENQKKYAENDARFKESPLLKELLERSKLNKEKNWQKIQEKYCIRGAEWGVGDCSAEGMSPEDRENFIAMLKKNAGE